MEPQKTERATEILRKENKGGGIILTGIKLQQKDRVVKTAWY